MTRTRVVAALAAVVGSFVGAVAATADDFWLVPNALPVAAGEALELRGQTSSRFPTSRSAVAPDRVVEAVRIGEEGTATLTGLSVRGRSLLIQDRPQAPGQYAVAVRLAPRAVRESAAGFRRYLELEGATVALARVVREGLLAGRDSVTRRYAKYAKALVEVGVGASGPRAFARAAGHPLEFIPLQDPASLVPGATLPVRLLYRGTPLAGAVVHASAVDFATDLDAPADTTHPTATPDVALTTDADGVVRVSLRRGGWWNVRTVHVVPAAPGSGADWDTHWSSLVFGIRER